MTDNSFSICHVGIMLVHSKHLTENLWVPAGLVFTFITGNVLYVFYISSIADLFHQHLVFRLQVNSGETNWWLSFPLLPLYSVKCNSDLQLCVQCCFFYVLFIWAQLRTESCELGTFALFLAAQMNIMWGLKQHWRLCIQFLENLCVTLYLMFVCKVWTLWHVTLD